MSRDRVLPALALAVGLGVCFGCGSAPGDPAGSPDPPPHAVGFPSRAPDLDVRPGFKDPPPGYGEVAFYWWLGDPLTKERLSWQLDRLAGRGLMGLQINYAHSDRGGSSWGLTYPSDPPLFREDWWALAAWFMGEAKKRGMAVSLSDYTLGIGQGWTVDELVRERPELAGAVLRAQVKDVGPAARALGAAAEHALGGRGRPGGRRPDRAPASTSPAARSIGPRPARRAGSSRLPPRPSGRPSTR